MSYLGLDIAVGKANWAFWNGGELLAEGETTLAGLSAILSQYRPAACAMEWTGRLAGQWANVCESAGTPAYIIHTNQRPAMVRLFGVMGRKDDTVDARMIARYLYLWHDPARRGEFGLPSTVFAAWSEVSVAWELRGLVADAEKVKEIQQSARRRVSAARASGQPDREKVWEEFSAGLDTDPIMSVALSFANEHFGEDMARLKAIPGVGDALAVQFIAALFPISRFVEVREGRDRTVDNVRKYLRWSPRREQTGTTKNLTRREKMPAHKLIGTLYFVAVGLASRPEQTSLGVRYKERRDRGQDGKTAIVRTADGLLSLMVALCRDGSQYRDTVGTGRKVAVKAKTCPDHLISQSDAARLLGISRQRIGQVVKARLVQTELYNGKTLVVKASAEARRALLDRGGLEGGGGSD